MEKPKLIVWRKIALDQVVSTLQYYEAELSVQAAKKLYAAIDISIAKLSEHPTIGRPSAKKAGVRSWIVKKMFPSLLLTMRNND